MFMLSREKASPSQGGCSECCTPTELVSEPTPEKLLPEKTFVWFLLQFPADASEGRLLCTRTWSQHVLVCLMSLFIMRVKLLLLLPGS